MANFKSDTFAHLQSSIPARPYSEVLKIGAYSSALLPNENQSFANRKRPSIKSFADALRQGLTSPAPQVARSVTSCSFTQRRRAPTAADSTRCFRCGRSGHMAKVCRDPVKCFRCGFNGHRQFNCPSRKSARSKISRAALAESWASMIFQDDSFLRLSDCSRAAINEELHRFNLNYLKLRKELIFSDREDCIRLLGLLDGLFNYNFMASSMAALLLDASAETTVFVKAKKEVSSLPVQEELISSASFSIEHAADFDCDDVIFLDPEVSFCRQSTSTVNSGLFYSQFVNRDEDVLTVVTKDKAHITIGLPPCLVSSHEPVELNTMPAKELNTVCTDLALFNCFEVLDFCLDEVQESPDTGFIAPLSSEGSLRLGTVAVVNETAFTGLCFIDKGSLGSSAFFDPSPVTEVSALADTDAAVGCGLESNPDAASPSESMKDSAIAEGLLSGTGNYIAGKNVTERVYHGRVNNDAENKCRGLAINVLNCENDAGNKCKRDLVFNDMASLEERSGSPVASIQAFKNSNLDCVPASPLAEDADSSWVTPPSGTRRGRKKKGFYKSSVVRRSARLGGSCVHLVSSDGGLLEPGVVGTVDSGTVILLPDCRGSAIIGWWLAIFGGWAGVAVLLLDGFWRLGSWRVQLS